jgi:aminobenzoyl-glutamate utilization protein B
MPRSPLILPAVVVAAATLSAQSDARSTIGIKGMIVAAKAMALTTVDLFTDPAHIQKAKAEFDERRGAGFVYKTRLADRKPALDYRK